MFNFIQNHMNKLTDDFTSILGIKFVDDYSDNEDLADQNIDIMFNDETEQSDITDLVHELDKPISTYSLGFEDHYE